MGNRVEDLERQVSELQAAVDGVTEELVETKERLRQLENEALAADEGSADADAAASADGRRSDGDAETATTEERHLPDDAGEGAPAEAGTEAEADKAGESVDSDDGEESEESDIIVA